MIDEIMLNHAPLVLGGGESPFAGLDGLRLRPIEVHASPNATHVDLPRRSLSARGPILVKRPRARRRRRATA